MNELPRDLVLTLAEKLGESIPHTPFISLKDKVLTLYQNAFYKSEFSNKEFYIEGKVVSQPKIHRNNAVTFTIVNNDGEKISIYVPSKSNLLTNVWQGNVVGIKGKLHFYKNGIINGYDYIQFLAKEVRNVYGVRKDYEPLLEYVRQNKKKKS